MKLVYELNDGLFQDTINIAIGLFNPLNGFVNSSDYHSIVNNMTLSDGTVWTIPISLDVPYEIYHKIVDKKRLLLTHKGFKVAYLEIDDCYIIDINQDIQNIFKTNDNSHPGVRKERQRYKYRLGGKIDLLDEAILENSLNPKETKEYFRKKGWKTICGFQTRNPIHKAHEHLQRIALEICDALFINPLVGWKKKGDFSEEAVIIGYKTMIDIYYTGLNVYFDTLKTSMRYAGPREAIFHALIRKNLGCTHFIIGRDHAGVGEFYGKYEAQELAREIMLNHDLGIELLLLSEPYFCEKCDEMVSERTCQHSKQYIQKISGTKIRAMLVENKRPSEVFMRKEISDSIISLKDKKFII